MTWHIGRAWVGHAIEDVCPCPKAPCGLAIPSEVICEDHHPADWRNDKTIRQAHEAHNCPAKESQ